MNRQLSTKEALGFDDRLLLLMGIPMLSFLIPVLLFGASLENGFQDYWLKWLFSAIYTAAYWLACRKVFIYFRLKYPRAEETMRRLLYTWLCLILAFFLINLVLDLFCGPLLEQSIPKISTLMIHTGSFLLLALVSTIYESIYLYANWRRSLIEAEKLRREQVESQLQGLKNQVNPHFLFNSLNTLAYLIPEDAERAVQFVQKLSRSYRYILETQDKKLVSLEEEMSFLQAYIFLLQERFGDNIRVSLAIPQEAKSLRLPPLAMQMLFENAIKHNIISQEQPLNIKVSVEGQNLKVENALQRKQQLFASTGIGLENIRSRYRYFTDLPVRAGAVDGWFVVELPLLPARLG